jgi:SAM-dependent methyltransferase
VEAFSDNDRRRVLERYDRRLAQLGPVPEALGWTRNRHVLRYAMLLAPWDLTTERVLDFGCGFGDMSAYCRAQWPEVRYTGVDVNPSLIAAGRARYPDADLRVLDAFTTPIEETWDFIVASGVFNLKLDNNWAFITTAFDWFAAHARYGFAANFLSNRVDYELTDTYHADPARVLDLAYRYSNRVRLRNDYMPFEFTVYVDLRKAFDRDYVVYPEYLPLVSGTGESGQ